MPLIQTNSINETNLSRLDGSRNWAILFVQSVLLKFIDKYDLQKTLVKKRGLDCADWESS